MRQRAVLQGRLKVTQDMVLGRLPRIANSPVRRQKYPRIASWVIFSRPYGLVVLTQTRQSCVGWTLQNYAGSEIGMRTDDPHGREFSPLKSEESCKKWRDPILRLRAQQEIS
jgi:hypothetical protein